eukprot:gene1974-biopygen11089
MRRDIALQLGVKSFLKPDAVPTVHVANEAPKISEEMSDRDRRQIVRSAIITPKPIETTTSDIGDDVEEADDNKELDSRVESNIACENCKSNKAKIVYLQKKVSKLKKKRAELYAKIEQLTNTDVMPEDMDASSLSGYIMDSGSDDNGLDEVHVSQDLSLENEDEEDWATLEESADSTDTEDDGNQFVSRNLVRHVLAISHFNENLNREARTALDGSVCYSVVYPKFKLGEEVVREVAIPPTYAYVDNIRNVLFSTPLEELGSVLDKYTRKVPEPLTAQFPNRRQKNDAISEYILKQSTTTPMYPTGWQWSSVVPTKVTTEPTN